MSQPWDTTRIRPASLDPGELGFTPRKPVAWLSPTQLAATGLRVAFASQFGAYLDKRELQGALPTQVYDDHASAGELWLDYIADMGDGFDATYSMAYLVAQEQIEVDGVDGTDGAALPRGKILVLGGDQVYPTASAEAYEDRFEGPYKAALPLPVNEDSPHLFALPGNHDWYDGLTAFLRLFARGRDAHIGGWRTKQTRSYFAIKLPHRWWLLAIDAQGAAYMDDPQLEFFQGVASLMDPGDRVIVAIPQPSWLLTEAHPRYYDTVDYFLRTVIDPVGADVAFMVSGDLHMYARYASADTDRQLINCGGGGAYTSATHHLAEEITVPPKHPLVRRSSHQSTYELAHTYPTKRRSFLLGCGVFGRLLRRNPGFAITLGIIHTMMLLAFQSQAGRIITIPTFAMVTIVMAMCIFFSVGLADGQRRSIRLLLGGLHGLAHVGLGIGGWVLWQRLPFHDMTWPLPVLSAIVVYLPVASVAAAMVVSGYLLLAAHFKTNVNELFAGQGIENYKSFLRLHIASDGTLTIYPIGVDKISKRWVPQDAGSWFRPSHPLKPRLIEEPITFAKADAAPRTPSGSHTPTP